LTLFDKADRLFKKPYKARPDPRAWTLAPLEKEESDRSKGKGGRISIKDNKDFPRWWSCLDADHFNYFPGDGKVSHIPPQLAYHSRKRPKGIAGAKDIEAWVDAACGECLKQ